MRLLHVTDSHLGIELQTWGGPPGWRRADDHEAALAAALGPALRGEVDAVLHSGDLFDRSSPPPEAIAAAARWLGAAGRRIPVWVMAGNHERRGVRELLKEARSVQAFDAPVAVEAGGVRLGLVPFCRTPEEFAEKARRAVAGGVDALATHQAVDGSAVPGFTFREGRTPDVVGERHLPGGVRHLLCGHVHTQQVVEIGGSLAVYPGSTARASVVEGGESKGAALWTFEAEAAWRFVPHPDRAWVRVDDEAALERVTPGALVRVPADGGPVLPEGVLRRGGIVAGRRPRGWSPPARQPGLFG